MIIPKFETQKEWVEPKEFPDLRQVDEIAVDLETRDPNLKTKGSGAVIGEGEVIGIAVAVPGKAFYFPIAHGSGPNMERKRVLKWATVGKMVVQGSSRWYGEERAAHTRHQLVKALSNIQVLNMEGLVESWIIWLTV